MFDLENTVELFIENVKKLFFPEEWFDLDLKFSKFELFAMLLLDKNKEITMTELVEYINSPMSTATGIIDRLVKNGYVLRERSETDRRVVMIRLTENGTKLIRSLKDVIGKYLNMVIEDLTDEEKQLLTKLIFKIINSFQTKLNAERPEPQGEARIKKIDIE